MSVVDDWDHLWFGVWREYGPPYRACPSIRDWSQRDVASAYDLPRLRGYLTSAQVVASTSKSAFPCPFTGQPRFGSISYRTDGVWLWLDDLPDLIEQHGIAIPSAFLRRIQTNRFTPPPEVDQLQIEALEWPVIEG